jgi:hypothetical protein
VRFKNTLPGSNCANQNCWQKPRRLSLEIRPNNGLQERPARIYRSGIKEQLAGLAQGVKRIYRGNAFKA